MYAYWQQQRGQSQWPSAGKDLLAEPKSLEPIRLPGDNADEIKKKIPKIFRRSFYVPKKPREFLNKKSRKLETKYSSIEDTYRNLEEQIRTSENILELQNKLGVTIIQKNGQRKLGGPPPGWRGPPPGQGCEIFVGKLPRNIYEDIIYPLFSKIGQIYEMRLMMNFSGTNRGFCFIMYETPGMAQKAIKKFNNYEIIPECFIGVVESVNNCRLHVTDLPCDIDATTLVENIWPETEELDKIFVYKFLNNQHSKEALICFQTHRGAAMARRRFLPERKKFFGKPDTRIEWAHPKIFFTNVVSCRK